MSIPTDPPRLRSVPVSPLPDPPYPADTYVRGWKFQIDHERLLQSDTWALASPEMRPWLLMIWHTAWQQRPAGSFTADRAIIAAKIGMDQRMFEAHADVLLRGFVRHSDGRLYHPVIVSQVLDWQEHNRKERARVKRWRDSRNADVTRNIPVSTTPEPEPEPEKRKRKKDIARFRVPEISEIADYCREKGYTHVNPQTFWHFYESKGWMVGKNKMRSWKRALAGWESRNAENQQSRSKSSTSEYLDALERDLRESYSAARSAREADDD